MSAVTEAFDAVKKTVTDLRKDNDKALEELKAGNEARHRELMDRVERQEAQITELIKARNDLSRQNEILKDRTEVLEAIADRPKGNVVAKMADEDCDLFVKWVRSGGKDRNAFEARDALKSKERDIIRETKTDTVTAGTALLGGAAVPKVISDQIERLILKLSGVVDAIGPMTVGTTDFNQIVTIAGGAGGWSTETGSRSQSNAANTRNVKPTWGELYAYPWATNWSLEDLFFDVQTWLINDVAENHAKALATSIYSGNGTGQCTGMTNTTPVTTADYASPMRAAAAYQFVSHNGVDTSSPNKLTLDILLAAIYTLAPGYRQGSQFAMNSTTQGIARRLKDTQGRYLWEPSVQAGQPDRLFGYPVFTWEDLADGNTVDGFVAAFGNWSRSYLLTNRGELAITVDPYTSAGTTKFYVRRRWGGIPKNNDSLKFVRNAD